jgi:gamma-glutamyltranspeptidase/glutathione hydrolase
VEILRAGGNAVDAAVATGLALAVVYPVAGNLGGGGFMVVHLADGHDTVIDYRETAPAGAGRDMYLDPHGNTIKGAGSSTVGWSASGVPGTVAGFALAWRKYGSGKVSWAGVIAPALRLAREGHTISQGTAKSLENKAALLAQFPASKAIFLRDGRGWHAGDHWVQSDLAATLERLAAQGPADFYTGETSRLIAAAMHAHHGGITAADLAAYRALERAPLRGRYRGCDIVTMPPPSSGGICLLQMLAMLEPHDVAALGQNSAAKDHLFAAVMQRAFRDRAEYMGDPAFVRVPVARLLDPAYLRQRMADFSPDRATPAAAIQPGLGAFVPSAPPHESMETTQFSVVDAAGNAVSNTYTLNGAFGSGVTIPGTGVLMNNEMDDFTSKPGTPNMFGLIQGEANAIAPGKRPLSSMTPTLVFKNGRLLLATGSPGGPTIINTVLQIISNVIDFNLPVSQAVEAPRIHNQWMPDVLTYERYGMSVDTADRLRAIGYTLKERDSYEGAYQGDGETVMIDPLTHLRLGAADPRKPDSRAIGY